MLGHALMKEWEQMKPIGLDKEELDITDRKVLLESIDRIEPQIIINCAAYTSVDGWEKLCANDYQFGKSNEKAY